MEGGLGSLGISLPTLLAQLVSFIVLFGLLYLVAYKPIMKMLDERSGRVKDSMEQVEQIVRCFKDAGAQAKISSIHVNGWFGTHDKLSTTMHLFKEVFKKTLDEVKHHIIFTGDSPNDSPMFAYFPHSVGVANLLRFRDKMETEPAWITAQSGGNGFAEMVDGLLSDTTG